MIPSSEIRETKEGSIKERGHPLPRQISKLTRRYPSFRFCTNEIVDTIMSGYFKDYKL